ncbi:MAG TPA: hypothetical protein VJZ71_04060 [Phycisphaerae bacterium]|nr:hypothetical protein [Phycisphaerae bacterium]
MDSRDPIGDSPPTARDQRRGWVRRHPVVTALAILFVCVAALIWQLDRRNEDAVTAHIAAIRARGEPSTIADILSQRPDIPDADNRAVAVEAAGKRLSGLRPLGDEIALLPFLGSFVAPPTGELCDASAIRASQEFLSQAGSVLNELHVALRLPRSYYKLQWSTPAINMSLSGLSEIGTVGKGLMLEAYTAAQLQDRDKATTCLRDGIGLTHLMDGESLLITALVQIALTARLQETLERCINLCGMDESALRDIQTQLTRHETQPDMKKALIGERVFFLDSIQWMRSTGSSPPTMPMPSWWTALPVIQSIDTALALDQFEQLVASTGPPDSSLVNASMRVDHAVSNLPRYCVVSKLLFSSFSRPMVLFVRNVGRNRALCAAVGAERFRLANGRWPERLDELVPEYLNAVPIDPIDGNPIRYAIIPEGIKTWTISDDDKNEDNGGDVRRLERPLEHGPTPRPKDHGWVILNPAMRNRPAQTTSQPTTRGAEK